MAEFKFECPYCNQHLLTEIDWNGQITICPSCKKTITISKPEHQDNINSYQCHICHNIVSEKASQCPKCGEPNAKLKGQKSKTIYLLLWLFLGGFGFHDFYIGRTNRFISKTILLITLLISPVWVEKIPINHQTSTIILLLCGAIHAGWTITDIFFIPNIDSDGIPIK